MLTNFFINLTKIPLFEAYYVLGLGNTLYSQVCESLSSISSEMLMSQGSADVLTVR